MPLHSNLPLSVATIATLTKVTTGQLQISDIFWGRYYRTLYLTEDVKVSTEYRAFVNSQNNGLGGAIQGFDAATAACSGQKFETQLSSPGFLPVVREQAQTDAIAAAIARDLPDWAGARTFLLNAKRRNGANSGKDFSWEKTTAETKAQKWGAGGSTCIGGNTPNIGGCANSDKPYFIDTNDVTAFVASYITPTGECMQLTDGVAGMVACATSQPPIIVCEFSMQAFVPHEPCDTGKTFMAWRDETAVSLNRVTHDEAAAICSRLQFRGRQGALATVVDSTNVPFGDGAHWRVIGSSQGQDNERNFWIANEAHGFPGLCMYAQVLGSSSGFAADNPSMQATDLCDDWIYASAMCEFCHARQTVHYHYDFFQFPVSTSGNRALDSSRKCATTQAFGRVGSVLSLHHTGDMQQTILDELLTHLPTTVIDFTVLLDAYRDTSSNWKWFEDDTTVAVTQYVGQVAGALATGDENSCLGLTRSVNGNNNVWQYSVLDCSDDAATRSTYTGVFCQFEGATATASSSDTITQPLTASDTFTKSDSETVTYTASQSHTDSSTVSYTHRKSVALTVTETVQLIFPPPGKVTSFNGRLNAEVVVTDFRSSVAQAVGADLSEVVVSSIERQTRAVSQDVCVYFTGEQKEIYAARFRNVVNSPEGLRAVGLESVETIESDGTTEAALCDAATPAPAPPRDIGDDDKKDISLGAFLGTILPLGVGILVVAAVLGALFFCCKKKKKNGEPGTGQADATNSQMQSRGAAETTQSTRAVSMHNVGGSPVISNGPPTNTKLVAPVGVPPPPGDGDWVWDTDSRLYWSDSEYLYYDPHTTKSYDPESGRWYDPSTGQWELRK